MAKIQDSSVAVQDDGTSMSTPYEWRIDDIERKAVRAESQLHRLDESDRRMDRLEYSVRELSSSLTSLRGEIETLIQRAESTEQKLRDHLESQGLL